MILTQDNEYAAVLDACVLAPMPLADTLLRCAEEPALYRALWSDEILSEVSRTLQKFGYTDGQASRRVGRMREAFPEASVAVPAGLVHAVPDIPDLNDRHVVAAAIHEKAHVIVTFNIRDFPQKSLDAHRIVVQSPDDFLTHQFHLNPNRVLEALDTQASAIRQGRTDVLERLRQGLPTFVSLVSGCRNEGNSRELE